MADDRNLTVHTYNEALAVEIYSRLHAYTELLRCWHEHAGKTVIAISTI
ncbi:MAG TPA: hypothetical protein PKC64_15325 [Sporomusa sphaeroides]|nr:hypothetical protein [Sporomusa sphaeroides]